LTNLQGIFDSIETDALAKLKSSPLKSRNARPSQQRTKARSKPAIRAIRAQAARIVVHDPDCRAAHDHELRSERDMAKVILKDGAEITG
jgi:hypothetical protein